MLPDTLAVYIHWPFCKSKCPYCDFNSHVAEQVDHRAWVKAYQQELKSFHDLTGPRKVTSVFFGGGTPSLMHPDTTAYVIKAIHDLWDVDGDCEITLEANPTSVEADKFKAFKDAGVNRVSLGVQALNDQALQFLGRTHSADEALAALNIARATFDRVSFDMIYARPEQNVEEWQVELEHALALKPDHMSLYQLTIEPQTAFYTAYQRGDFKIPDDDLGGILYEVTQNITASHGLPAYEISNHARTGQESRHNLAYWRYDDYIGVGPGAHGRFTHNGQKLATRGVRAPDVWLNNKDKNHPFETVSLEESIKEILLMGLRLKEGVPFARLNAVIPHDWQNWATQNLGALYDEGYIESDAISIWATAAGLQRLNAVLGFMVERLSCFAEAA